MPLCSLVLLSLLSTGTASAASNTEYLLQASGSLDYIDNPRRVNAAPGVRADASEVARRGTLHGSLNRSTTHVQTSVDYSANKVDYKNDLLRDRTFITGNGTIRLSSGPDGMFAWSLSNTRSMQLLESFQPDTLDNRQVVSITSTGPEWNIPIRGAHRLTGFYNYSYAEFENSFLPTQDRQSASLQYLHTLSGRLALTAGVNVLDTRMSDGFPGFRRTVYSVGGNYTAGALDLSLSVGESVVDRDFRDEMRALMVNFTGRYAINSRLSTTVQYSESMEDLFSNLRFLPFSGVEPTAPPVDEDIGERFGDSTLTQIYERINMSVGLNYSIPESLSANASLSRSERNFDEGGRTIHSDTANVSVSIPAGLRTTFTVYSRYSEFEFPNQSRVQDRFEVGVRSSTRIGQRMSMGLRLFSVRQDGTLPIDNYDGYNAGITLTYRLGG